jgi:DNA-directed RNA polymerase subunit RPC12/RpoP
MHQCADCGYEYPESDFQATAPEDRQCPTCGSRRINAIVQAHVAIAVSVAATVTAYMTTNVWATWLRIAIDRARAARAARADAVSDPAMQAEHLAREFEGSMVAIAASAHALDALYGSSAVPASVRDRFKGKRPGRRNTIREALKAPFDTGPMNDRWVVEFDWLFDLRDDAAHAEETLQPSVPHPIGSNVSHEWATYRVEAAERAVGFVLDVFTWCVDHPRPSLPDSVQWSTAHRGNVHRLAEEWRGSREALEQSFD